MTRKPKIPQETTMSPTENSQPKPEPNSEPEVSNVTPILKPSGFSLDRFKSKRPAAMTGVKTLLGALPHHPLADANDFVRLHPDEDAYWSPELCFVDVPIVGVKRDTVHLIDEALIGLLPAGKKVARHALALAAKPYNNFFLAHVPTVNLDNSWNESNLQGCRLAKTHWVQLASLKAQDRASASTPIFLAANFDNGVDDPVVRFKLFNPSIHYKSLASLWFKRNTRSGSSG